MCKITETIPIVITLTPDQEKYEIFNFWKVALAKEQIILMYVGLHIWSQAPT
jgi:hypothetical protein